MDFSSWASTVSGNFIPEEEINFAIHEPRDSGRGQHTGGNRLRAGRCQTACDAAGDMRPGFARIAPDQHPGTIPMRAALGAQVLAQRLAGAVERSVVQRVFARNAANAVGAEELFRHEIEAPLH